jgi:DNA-binding NtrC family response regulator
MILLETHPWPGNIAQLQDTILRAQSLAGSESIDRQHLLGPTTGFDFEPEELAPPPRAEVVEEGAVREEDILPLELEEKRLLARALKATKGNVRRAAQLLRIGRATLYRKIQIYKLKLQ